MNSVIHVFWQFFLLGWVSFGGPAAHIGYFQRTFVEQKKWLSRDEYARLVALSQFLPGPGSSQVGFAIGLNKAGIGGGIAAFLGFTLPSFLLLFALSVLGSSYAEHSIFLGMVTGLKLLAVVVVLDACITMFKQFCSVWQTQVIAGLSVAALFILSGISAQIIVLIAAALIALFIVPRQFEGTEHAKSTTIKWLPMAVFTALFISLPLLADTSLFAKIAADFYYAGSLVFGGGHVVLPLLQESIGASLSSDQFLTGYAAAQAVPGPMFTLASYLGAELFTDSPLLGAIVATVAVFLPGFLLILALKDHWQSIATKPVFSSAIKGINAAVVGILVHALYQPVFISAVHDIYDMLIVVLGIVALRVMKVAIIWVVLASAFIGVFLV